MSQENVEVVRAAYEAFARGDRGVVARFADPEIEWTPLLGALLGVEKLTGREAVLEFLFDIENYIDGWRTEPDEFVDLGDDGVLVLETRHGRPKGTDAKISQPTGAIYRLRDRLIVSVRAYPSKREALEAAGLSEQGGVGDTNPGR